MSFGFYMRDWERTRANAPDQDAAVLDGNLLHVDSSEIGNAIVTHCRQQFGHDGADVCLGDGVWKAWSVWIGSLGKTDRNRLIHWIEKNYGNVGDA